MDLRKMVQEVQKEGYSFADANAKVCQDVVLKGIADSSLSRNVTIKGGVVMRSIRNLHIYLHTICRFYLFICI